MPVALYILSWSSLARYDANGAPCWAHARYTRWSRRRQRYGRRHCRRMRSKMWVRWIMLVIKVGVKSAFR